MFNVVFLFLISYILYLVIIYFTIHISDRCNLNFFHFLIVYLLILFFFVFILNNNIMIDV